MLESCKDTMGAPQGLLFPGASRVALKPPSGALFWLFRVRRCRSSVGLNLSVVASIAFELPGFRRGLLFVVFYGMQI